MSTRIEDLIDEQDAARVLAHRDRIIAAAAAVPDEARSVHFAGQAMACGIAEYLESVTDRMDRLGMPSADHVRKLADQARQLEAHHLDYLDRLSPA